jgi:hypothetical protein
MDLGFQQTYEFYEADEKSSLSKISYRDNNGIHLGKTSSNGYTPIGYGVREQVPVNFNSFPDGGAIFDSPLANSTRVMSELVGTSMTHKFDESLKYIYQAYNAFGSTGQFFDHNFYAFARFDRKQLRYLKSCQMQVGVVNRLEYDALRPELRKYDRMYQGSDYLKTLSYDDWSWNPSYYESTSGTWRRKTSYDNMLMVGSAVNATYAMEFANYTDLGTYNVNVTKALYRQYGVNGKTATTASPLFVDWMFYASYVNNFKYTVESIMCDGRSGSFFKMNNAVGIAPGKSDAMMSLESAVIWPMKTPFYIIVTGAREDVGHEVREWRS